MHCSDGGGGWWRWGVKWVLQECVYGVGKRAVEPHDLNMKLVCALSGVHVCESNAALFIMS